ncbi:MAG TPA: hypothetical protein GX742_03785, partial [Acholeplasmataceae bacterium]|nr:hypothetical protein [Acholeplasmataceae bacterium]
MKLNLYKIDSDFNEEINSKLEEKDYILCGSVSVESIKYDLFVNQNNRENIFWLNSMKQVFGTLNDMDNFGTIYNGILLISFSKIRKYAVTFGYAFHVLQEICDLNFAMDFAEKQLQSSHINLKSSSYVQNVKIKGLINLRSDLIAMNEAGESFNFVSGTPLNTDHFGKKLECSNSIQCSKKFSLQNLEDLKKIGHHINQIDLVIS